MGLNCINLKLNKLCTRMMGHFNFFDIQEEEHLFADQVLETPVLALENSG